MKLSIIIPVFNESKTIEKILKQIDDLDIAQVEKEVIVVDDASTDMTSKRIETFLGKGKKGFFFFQHKKNQGKGAAVKTGISHVTGDFIVIQDADLEYNPKDIIRLANEVKKGKHVVYGTRLKRLPHFGKEENRPQFLFHYVGNKFLSFLTSVLYGQWITDMETCYKIFPVLQAKKMKLSSRGFEFEPEITAKLIKAGLRIHEIPITTTPRGYEEGKKLNSLKDGTRAVWTLLKYRFVD